jgi:pimeloyl-[acyl-carrier protein] synthase
MIRISAEPFPDDCDPTLPGHPDPYPLYHRLRRDDPVHWSPFTNAWMLTRYADAIAYLRSAQFSRVAYLDAMRAKFGKDQPILAFQSRELAFTDPPEHSWLRSLMGKAFSPQRIEAMRPHIEEVVRASLDRLGPRGAMNVIADFAYPIPADVISAMLGVPREDWAMLRHWVEGIVISRGVIRTPEMMAEGARVTKSFEDYLGRLMSEKRKAPGAGLLIALIAAEEHGRTMPPEQIVTTIETLFAAGHATTRNLIANGLIALLGNPAEHRRLRENPAMISSAVEEMLRYDSPTQAPSPQIATADVEMGGVRIRRGDAVSVLIGAANRDPARFEDPDRFDIARPDNEHLAFSHGLHYCLGASLARMEGQIAIAALVQRFPNLRLAASEIEWEKMGRFRGPREVRVEF